MSHRLLFQKLCVKYALSFQFLNSYNEGVYAINILSNQGHNKEELHLMPTAAIRVISEP